MVWDMLDKLTDEEMEEGRNTRLCRALVQDLRRRRKEYQTFITRQAGGGMGEHVGLVCSYAGRSLLCEELIDLIERGKKEE